MAHQIRRRGEVVEHRSFPGGEWQVLPFGELVPLGKTYLKLTRRNHRKVIATGYILAEDKPRPRWRTNLKEGALYHFGMRTIEIR